MQVYFETKCVGNSSPCVTFGGNLLTSLMKCPSHWSISRLQFLFNVYYYTSYLYRPVIYPCRDIGLYNYYGEQQRRVSISVANGQLIMNDLLYNSGNGYNPINSIGCGFEVEEGTSKDSLGLLRSI